MGGDRVFFLNINLFLVGITEKMGLSDDYVCEVSLPNCNTENMLPEKK